MGIYKRIVKLTYMNIIATILLSGCAAPRIADMASLSDKSYDLSQLELGIPSRVSDEIKKEEALLEHYEILGLSHVRMRLDWSQFEPQQGDYRTEVLKKDLEFYELNHIEVLLTLEINSLPEWTKTLSKHQRLEAFNQYLDQVLLISASKIHQIQLGNEWDKEIDLYLDGDYDTYITMHQSLEDKLEGLSVGEEISKPSLVLGSLSPEGLYAIAYSQQRLENVFFMKGPLYNEAQLANIEPKMLKVNELIEQVVEQVAFEVIDVHLYDDYWNWHHYVEGYKELIMVSSHSDTYSLIASEFGGPNEVMEPEDDVYRAVQLYHYITALDHLAVEKGYYTRLMEGDGTSSGHHPFSYLVTGEGELTKTYEILRRFGE